ncbi:DUF1266 domain-containing protein [Streptomyces sp. NPDC051907]|uniref:DUF1266 domain-containing protein n=1 Tax=Streptomyces sp. NPDC051907 TaxID=3155284 RepID=UPI003447BF2C
MTTSAWQAPTDVEKQLYAAKVRGDRETYLDVLAGTQLFHAMARDDADDDPETVIRTPYVDGRTGRECYAFLTEGELPVPAADTVYFSVSLGWTAEVWHDDTAWLAVNPGTPSEMFLPGTPSERALWREHDARTANTEAGNLRTLRVGGPTEEAVVRGLGCAAHLNVRNGELWNALPTHHGQGYAQERHRLDTWWGVTDREDWQGSQERLLNGGVISPFWDFVLELRQILVDEYGAPVDVTLWRALVERAMLRREQETGDSGVPGGIEAMQQLVGRILRYEARFRADGLLPADGYVRTVLAWDYGRAASMARWGLGARYCDLAEAEDALIRAAQAAQAEYDSWEEFSTAFVLGRCLHFDEEGFGEWYTEVLDAHRILTSDAESPWLTVPWK